MKNNTHETWTLSYRRGKLEQVRIEVNLLPSKELWTFPYPVADVLAAARQRLAYHEARLAHWRARIEELRDKLPDGIKIRGFDEFVGASAKNSTYNAMTPRLQIDDAMRRDFDQAIVKVDEHRGQRDNFRSWVAVLAGQKDQTDQLWLSFSDVVFFAMHEDLSAWIAQDEALDG